MTANAMAMGAGAAIRQTCPHCAAIAANTAQGADYPKYTPMPKTGKGSRTNRPQTNWIAYHLADVVCDGEWGRHYRVGGVSILWLIMADVPESGTGQMRLL